MPEFSNRLPVIIPAFNEAAHIQRTLSALPADLVEPLVVVNGSTDNTAAIAESFGVNVIEREEQGKLPAVQHALRVLNGAALQPLGLLDADARPLFQRSWPEAMVKNLTCHDEATAEVVGGPVWFTEGSSIVSNAIRSVRRAQVALTTRDETTPDAAQLGPNMGLHLKQPHFLERFLAMPHFWPGEDRAIAHTILDEGGRYRQPITPNLLVITPVSLSFTSLKDRIRLGRDGARQQISAAYQERGAAGSIPYEDLTIPVAEALEA